MPYDYIPSGDFDKYLAEVDSSQLNYIKWDNLRERPYFSTNKPYLYPGETVWLGGIMHYRNKIMADTLSRVIYVDLMNKDAELIQAEIFSIKERRISGAFVLQKNLKPGDYFLRAYTEWMRNYPDQDIFLRALPILDKNENIRSVASSNPDLFGDLTINLSETRGVHDSFDEVEFQLSFLDETEEFTDAQFVVSLTDPDLVSTVAGIETVIKSMEWLDENHNHEDITYGNHQIEYGITLDGQFTRAKKRDPYINPITVVRDDLADYGIVQTDSSGYFRSTGLYFKDTATISIAAVDSKQKHYGSVTINEKSKPTFKGSYPKLNYQTFERENDELKFDFTGDYVLLEEFVKEDTKMETLEERNYGYGTPDRELSGNRLETISPQALAGYLGLKNGGKSVGNYNFGFNASNPLLIIDGAQYPFLDWLAFENMISLYIPSEMNPRPVELESIKVYTYNSASFEMVGVGGVIMITTKKGNRFEATEPTAFNSFEFQQFKIRGFSQDIPFPTSYENDQPVESKPTLFWDANAESDKGVYSFKVKIPQALKRMNLRVEGLTKDGLAFEKSFEVGMK